MAWDLLQNRKDGTVTVWANANTTLTIAGNTSSSNVAANGETLTGASVKQVWFGSPSGASAYWVLKRGSTTVAVYDSTGWVDYAGNGNLLNKDPDASLVLELVGTANGYIVVEMRKHGANQGYYS